MLVPSFAFINREHCWLVFVIVCRDPELFARLFGFVGHPSIWLHVLWVFVLFPGVDYVAFCYCIHIVRSDVLLSVLYQMATRREMLFAVYSTRATTRFLVVGGTLILFYCHVSVSAMSVRRLLQTWYIFLIVLDHQSVLLCRIFSRRDPSGRE